MQLHHEIAGSGDTIVLIHAGIADSRMWTPQWRRYAEDYQVVRYDMRGFGQSPLPPEPYQHAQDLLDLLDRLEIERAVLIGNSLGGRVALHGVVGEDLLVAAARERLAVCAVLAHADAVPVSAPGHDEHGLAVGRRRRLLSGGRAGRDEDKADGGDEERAHEGIQGNSAGLGVCVVSAWKGPLLSYSQEDSWTSARAFSGSHQPRFPSYHATVSANPSSNPRVGVQPSSSEIFEASSRYLRS